MGQCEKHDLGHMGIFCVDQQLFPQYILNKNIDPMIAHQMKIWHINAKQIVWLLAAQKIYYFSYTCTYNDMKVRTMKKISLPL